MPPVPGSALSTAKPRLIVSAHCCTASVTFSTVQAVARASGGAGGSAAEPEHAAPATAAPAAKARRKADKRRAAVDNVTKAGAHGRGAPSEGTPGKRHRATAAGAPSNGEAVVARTALGVAEAEARYLNEAIDEHDDGGDARAALRRLGVRNADPRFAAALAHERADFAMQARCLGHCAVVGCRAAACSRMVSLQNGERVSLLSTATHVGSMGHAIVSSADTANVPHSVPRLADRASLPRCTERAPMRALRRRQRPSSALPRRWRSSARSSTSRCGSRCLCGSAAVTHRPGLLLQSVHAPGSG